MRTITNLLVLKQMSFNSVHEWQNSGFDHLSDVKVCPKSVQDSNEGNSIIIENSFPYHNDWNLSTVSTMDTVSKGH